MDNTGNVTLVLVALIAAIPGILAFVSQRLKDVRETDCKEKVKELQEENERLRMKITILEHEVEKMKQQMGINAQM